MPPWEPIPGETPIDDISGLKVPGIATRKELNRLEAENIKKAVLKYLAKRPSRRSAPFDLSWSQKLHHEMFGKVWKWAGEIRRSDKTIGVPWSQAAPMLPALLGDLVAWDENKIDLSEQAVLLHKQYTRST